MMTITRRNNLHSLGLQLDKLRTRVTELEKENATLRQGRRPASEVRDLVLTALKQIKEQCEGYAEEGHKTPINAVNALIHALGSNIPGDVPYKDPPKPAPPKHYKPLDHGPRDPEAADPKFR